MRRWFLVLAVLLIVPTRPAQADGGSLGLGVGVSKTDPLPDSLFLTGNFRIPLVSYLQLEPEVGYWKKDYTLAGVDLSAEDLSFGGNAILVIPVTRLSIWGGGGVGAHRLKGSLGIPGLLTISDSETKLGIHLLGGLDISLSPKLSLFGAGRYNIIQTGSGGKDNTHETQFYGGLRIGL
jgi:opacity protein-like surface antigen